MCCISAERKSLERVVVFTVVAVAAVSVTPLELSPDISHVMLGFKFCLQLVPTASAEMRRRGRGRGREGEGEVFLVEYLSEFDSALSRTHSIMKEAQNLLCLVSECVWV